MESWDGNFRAILLHVSIEYLASDIKDIKETLERIQKYILSKTIESGKANDIKNLEGVSNAVWEFISSLYEAHWDSLFIDDSNTLLRNKVKSKFSLQALKKPANNKGKNTVKPSYISTLPSSIPAKLSKEVNEISKYFKKNSFSIQKNIILKHHQIVLTWLGKY